MEQIDVSVSVCTYNRAGMLARALGSLICQETNGRFSYEIVVDDGSTDSTGDIVKGIAAASQAQVRYVGKEGGGVAAA